MIPTYDVWQLAHLKSSQRPNILESTKVTTDLSEHFCGHIYVAYMQTSGHHKSRHLSLPHIQTALGPLLLMNTSKPLSPCQA